MLTVPKGGTVDVYCDAAGRVVPISKPSGASDFKLCSVTATDLKANYDLSPSGSGYVTGDGDLIPKEKLKDYLVESVRGMRDGGAEWGWEFKVA